MTLIQTVATLHPVAQVAAILGIALFACVCVVALAALVRSS